MRLAFDRITDVLPAWLLPRWVREPGGGTRWMRHVRTLITHFYDTTVAREKELAHEAKLGRKKKRVGRAARGLAGSKRATIVSESDSDDDDNARQFDAVDILGYAGQGNRGKATHSCGLSEAGHVGRVRSAGLFVTLLTASLCTHTCLLACLFARRFVSKELDDVLAWADDEVGPCVGVRVSKRRQAEADEKMRQELEAAAAIGGKAARKAKAKAAKRRKRRRPRTKTAAEAEIDANLQKDVDEVRILFRKLVDTCFLYVSGPTRFSFGNGDMEWALGLQQLDLLRVFFRDQDPEYKAQREAAEAAKAKAERERKKKERARRAKQYRS